VGEREQIGRQDWVWQAELLRLFEEVGRLSRAEMHDEVRDAPAASTIDWRDRRAWPNALAFVSPATSNRRYLKSLDPGHIARGGDRNYHPHAS
jgi:hypothetical protein